MILYNVTLKVDPSIHDEWIIWMENEHIPDVLATGYFQGCRMSKLLGQDESDGKTYSIQYASPSMKDLHQYQATEAPRLKQEHVKKYGEKVLAYRTMMEVIGDFSATHS